MDPPKANLAFEDRVGSCVHAVKNDPLSKEETPLTTDKNESDPDAKEECTKVPDGGKAHVVPS